MRRSALVTGSRERVDSMATALEAAGFSVTGVADPTTLSRVCAGFQRGSLHCYVQMPGRIVPCSDSVVGRLREFLTQGLLARYEASARVLPVLSDDAVVVLVSGNQPATSGLPDDQAARVGLLRVLAQAILADTADTNVHAAVVEHGRSTAEIAELARQGGGQRLRVVPDYGQTGDISYVDWRLRILELASMEG